MTTRTVVLSPANLERLRAGRHVWTDDNLDGEVGLVPTWSPEPASYAGATVLWLNAADLDVIEREPTGLQNRFGFDVRLEPAR